MVMKVRIFDEPLIVPPEDIEMVYRSVLHYTDSLEQFAGWIDQQPENENALKNIREEIAEYRHLSLSIYERFFGRFGNRPVERPNKVKP